MPKIEGYKKEERGRKRVAMISEHASPLALLGGEDSGGQNVYVDQLSRHLGQMGYQVDVFTRREGLPVDEVTILGPGVRVINVAAGPATYLKKDLLLPFMPAFRDWMLRFIARHNLQYEVIHSHFWMSGWVGCELKAELGLPLVHTYHALGAIKRLHQGTADTSPAERPEVEQRIIDEADAIVATCPAELDDLRTLYRLDDESKVAIIPCGVDRDFLRPLGRAEARRQLFIPLDVPLVVYIGRVLPRKGIDNVIRGVAEVVRRGHMSPRLIVVGGEKEDVRPTDNLEIRRLARVAQEEGISHLVSFTGPKARSALPYLYAAADVTVTTPWYELFGMVPLESMACGTPVIASDLGGHRFSIVSGEAGYLVPPRDPAALEDRLEQVLGQAGERRRLSQNGLKRVADLFTWEKVTDQIAKVYAAQGKPSCHSSRRQAWRSGAREESAM